MSLSKVIQAAAEGASAAEIVEKLGQDVAFQYREIIYAPKEELDELAALLKPATNSKTTKKEI
jgi:hypothetical protein